MWDRRAPAAASPPPPHATVCVALIAICLASAMVPQVSGDNFTLGYLMTETSVYDYKLWGRAISGAITYAVEVINNDPDILPGHTLSFVPYDTQGIELGSLSAMTHLWREHDIVGFIGPAETCKTEARLAAAWDICMISYRCAEYEVSNKELYPTFARTYPPDTQISKSLVALLKHFDWDVLTIVTAEDPQWSAVAGSLRKDLGEANITLQATEKYPHPYYPGFNDFPDPFPPIIDRTYQDTRIYLFLGEYFTRVEFMRVMQQKGLLTNGEYIVITIDTTQYNQDTAAEYLKDPYEIGFSPELISAYQSMLVLVSTPPLSDTYQNFTKIVAQYSQMDPFNYENPRGGIRTVPVEAAYLYDAVMLFAVTLTELLEEKGSPKNGSTIIEKLINRQYESVRGTLGFIDNKADAESNFTVIARQPIQTTPGYGMLPVGLFQMINSKVIYVPKENVVIDWVAGKPPLDMPECGFHGEDCPVDENHTDKIVGGTMGGISLVMIIIAAVVYRNWKYEQDLASLLWKIDYRDITIRGDNNLYRSSSRMSLRSIDSIQSTDVHTQQIFTKIGTYKSTVVAIKHVNKKSVDLTRKVRKELKAVRDLRHDNINLFIGACVDHPHICIITEYCPRGSLQDILENDEIKLDNMFTASLISDIIKGMLYLHNSEIRYHGNLKSSNCVVDSRWVVKISDFGLQEFKAGADDDIDEIGEFAYYQRLLWRAPEFLRMSQSHLAVGFQKGDVYSFGIILYEIVLRQGPYGNCEYSPKEIVERVITPNDPIRPFRPWVPTLREIDAPDYFIETMQECWAENPENRPDFKVIRVKLKAMQKGMKANIFDNMIAIMEKYANNLESIVEDRTQLLIEEKKKTDNLLNSMLPKYVANQLKKGKQVEPEAFEWVTIYFSDIVGFTKMSSESTPWQVIDLLNDLYTLFDSTIKTYDVYKVETIGDAYMLVSGLPIRNGNRHAAEVASSALHLLDEICHFKIRHKPDEQLKLRIGIHSGSVCAGVVGLTMPRYCLFGDTVNTASRMESNGEPLKIHISPTCRDILEEIGGYVIRERGYVKMKGKGEILTYWLEGQDPKYKKVSTVSQPEIERLSNDSMSRYDNEDETMEGGERTPVSSLQDLNLVSGSASDLVSYPAKEPPQPLVALPPPPPPAPPSPPPPQPASVAQRPQRINGIHNSFDDFTDNGGEDGGAEVLSVKSNFDDEEEMQELAARKGSKKLSFDDNMNGFPKLRQQSPGSPSCRTPLMQDSDEPVWQRRSQVMNDKLTILPVTPNDSKELPTEQQSPSKLESIPLIDLKKAHKKKERTPRDAPSHKFQPGTVQKRSSLSDSGFDGNNYDHKNDNTYVFT